MSKKIYLFSLLLSLTSCDNSERVQEGIGQDSIAEVVKELKSGVSKKEAEQNLSTGKRKRTIFQEMGIEFSDEKLIIDINKTNNFFGTLEKRLERHAKEFEQKVENKIEQIDINITRDMGIDVKEEEINIDLNKTKKMLDNISHIFESILFESNSTKF
jgi:uncharacterized protein YpuA (DUF1002 family)